MQRPLRLFVSAFGDPGHAFPAIGLARALHERGHEVLMETWGRWREPVENLGIAFTASEDYTVYPSLGDTEDPFVSAADAALPIAEMLEEFRPDVVVSDILTLAPTLAAERGGWRHASLVPHLYPVTEDEMPLFTLGFRVPRTAVGRAAWRAVAPTLQGGHRRGRRELNEARARLGVAPQQRLHSGLSERLVMVGTFPALEYPRRWPAHVHVTGPMGFELPHPDIALPPGDEPLVVVAPSTSKDWRGRLVRSALEGLADEPVRVVATLNRHVPPDPIRVPANAVLVDWMSYSQVMAQAALVVCHGGHGTVARALGEGVPVLACPADGDQPETAARLTWSGTGLGLPKRFVAAPTVRAAVRRILGDPGFARNADGVGRWARTHDGAARGAELVEQLARS